MDATDSMLSICQTVILGRQQVGQALLCRLVVPERGVDQMLAKLLDALAHVRPAAVRSELQGSTDAPKQARIAPLFVIGSWVELGVAEVLVCMFVIVVIADVVCG